MNKHRAVFLDRDGVLNRLIYHRESGVIDSPFTVAQFRLLPGAARAVKRLNRLGLKTVLVSNQPGIAKRHFTRAMLDAMTEKLKRSLARQGAHLDSVYYCPHHPHAELRKYRVRCQCRKPKPGMLKRAAQELDLDLENSFMVGDNLTDIQAGHAAGCTTILIGDEKCETCRFLQAKKVKPDYIARDIMAAAGIIESLIPVETALLREKSLGKDWKRKA